jgi:hypothetical protein
MSENIAAAHRWAIDKGAAHTKVTSVKSQSQVYYDLVRKEVEEYAALPHVSRQIKSPRSVENFEQGTPVSGNTLYFSAMTSISKSSVVKTSFLEKAPSFAPKISTFENPSDLKSHDISLGT